MAERENVSRNMSIKFTICDTCEQLTHKTLRDTIMSYAKYKTSND